MKTFKNLYLPCSCYSLNHLVRVTYDEWDANDPYVDLCIEVTLNHYKSFLQRVWSAIKYVFKFDSVDGHYESVMLTQKTAIELRDFLNMAIKTGKLGISIFDNADNTNI